MGSGLGVSAGVQALMMHRAVMQEMKRRVNMMASGFGIICNNA